MIIIDNETFDKMIELLNIRDDKVWHIKEKNDGLELYYWDFETGTFKLDWAKYGADHRGEIAKRLFDLIQTELFG